MKHRGHFAITDVDRKLSKIVQKFRVQEFNSQGQKWHGIGIAFKCLQKLRKKESEMWICNTRDWTSMSELEAGNEKRHLKYWVRTSINLILHLFLKASRGITAPSKEFVFIFSTDRLIVFPLVLGE